jgi:hypothetical protein
MRPRSDFSLCPAQWDVPGGITLELLDERLNLFSVRCGQEAVRLSTRGLWAPRTQPSRPDPFAPDMSEADAGREQRLYFVQAGVAFATTLGASATSATKLSTNAEVDAAAIAEIEATKAAAVAAAGEDAAEAERAQRVAAASVQAIREAASARSGTHSRRRVGRHGGLEAALRSGQPEVVAAAAAVQEVASFDAAMHLACRQYAMPWPAKTPGTPLPRDMVEEFSRRFALNPSNARSWRLRQVKKMREIDYGRQRLADAAAEFENAKAVVRQQYESSAAVGAAEGDRRRGLAAWHIRI